MALTKVKPASGDMDIGLNAKSRKEVAQCLSELLADSYLLQLKTQFYHWNVTGENFLNLHLLFEKQYDELAEAVDELAERIRALGHVAPGTFHQFSELTSLEEDIGLPSSWQKMVVNLAEAHETVTRAAREKLEAVQKAEDEGTADILIRRLQAHEKSIWMLRSHL